MRLPPASVMRLMPESTVAEQARAVDERHEAEVDQLLARERPARGAAFDIDASARTASMRSPRPELDPSRLELRETELALHAGGDALAQLDRIALRRLVRAYERERRGCREIAEPDFAVGLDFGERIGCADVTGACKSGEQHDDGRESHCGNLPCLNTTCGARLPQFLPARDSTPAPSHYNRLRPRDRDDNPGRQRFASRRSEDFRCEITQPA
jgi:hypothetical protein